MSLFFSPSRCGFFSADIHGDAIPDDALKVTPARHRELLAGQAGGATIVAGEDGRPKLRRPRATLADKRARLIARIKRHAARRIDIVAPPWRQMNDLRDPASPAAMARFAAIDAIRAASNTIETVAAHLSAGEMETFDVATHPAWPAIPESDLA